MLSESKLTKIYQKLHQIPELALAEVGSFLAKNIPILLIFVYNIECMFGKRNRLIFCAKIDNLLSRT